MRKMGILECDTDIVLSGSIFKCKFQGFQDAVEREILKKMPGANVIAAEYEPVIGAVLMGLKRMNRVLAGGIYRNIEEGAARFPGQEAGKYLMGKGEKKMKAKKVLGFVLAGTMIAALAGCGSTGGTAKEKTDTDKKESSKESGEDINLTFWHIWPDAEMGEIVDSYVEKFEEEHPNVHIEAVATQEVEYQNNKLKVAAATGSQGDVFVCWGGGYAKNYVEAGNVLQLDELMEKNNTKDDLLEGTLTYGTYDDKVYGLPLKQWAGALFCNEDLFEEYNVKIPETFDELLER